MVRWPAAGLSALALAACASSPADAPAGEVAFEDAGVVVPVGRRFEVARRDSADGSTRTVALRRPAPVRGSFENCSVEIVAAPAGAAAAGVAAEAATRRHALAASYGGLTNVTLVADAEPAVVTSDFTIEMTMRTRERFWGVSRGGRVWLVHQDCQTVGSPEDLLALEAATAPAFLPDAGA